MVEERSTRHRVNISRTSKGLISWDCTYEVSNGTQEEALAGSDALVAELQTRYPIVEEEKK
ncbi:hypothetical protein LCGC14_1948160 [marine sediment metagenome]|uniref:Uncharacterized protein n=1 Tax=marine sediment metagenome TaxID=412755 RepID=A0A0F9IF99_9ZZZZ